MHEVVTMTSRSNEAIRFGRYRLLAFSCLGLTGAIAFIETFIPNAGSLRQSYAPDLSTALPEHMTWRLPAAGTWADYFFAYPSLVCGVALLSVLLLLWNTSGW